MPEKHLFEYAVIRLMPRVEREEFINVGVIMYCAEERFLQTAYALNRDRLLAFYEVIDIKEVEARLLLFQRICRGGKEAGPIGQLPIAARFRWLTASCSTVIQTSAVHPGLCKDAQQTLEHLLKQLVL
ncbi:hypothetical protein OKW21_000296 [Catalinimonas alkaloidigena]|uniref:DUF3037 domain-containing protein n=1 Tax=Catalinimonas alkaloidigena TaxID=1075417 RepID=UPI002404C70B|nr:DUF3037 domain-containing protein [Catalinimonas alkaloidigena]MDF9795033.1 hypothetical protein [Catalinimonas alkaloidigena]